jgi:hypothetical protein
MSKKDNNIETGGQIRTKGASRTLFKDTLTRIALENDSAKLRKLCNQLWDIALDGSLPLADRFTAMKMLQDRIDGRAAQSVEITDRTVDLPSAGQFKIVKVEPNSNDN